MNECRLLPFEVFLERIFIYDFYDGITEGFAFDGVDTIFVLTRKTEVEVADPIKRSLYAYDVRILNDARLVDSIRANSQPNVNVNLYGSVPWYEPIMAESSFRLEQWMAFCLRLGKQTVYRIENCPG